MNTKLVWLALCLLAGGGSLSWASPADGPPEWTDEPPTLSRWIEEGYQAQSAGDPLLAAQRYCSAARFGSIEAQYRLGRLYLDRKDPQGPLEGRAMLALAAQRGHARAAEWVGSSASLDALPDCLLTGQAPQFHEPKPVVEPAIEPPVPSEVVERYILALPTDRQRHAKLIRYLAPRFEVDYRLALAIARAESNFDHMAVSPKNAQGLMQLIPDTAARFGVRNAFDPEQNFRGGLWPTCGGCCNVSTAMWRWLQPPTMPAKARSTDMVVCPRFGKRSNTFSASCISIARRFMCVPAACEPHSRFRSCRIRVAISSIDFVVVDSVRMPARRIIASASVTS
jgi:hypothetical protein